MKDFKEFLMKYRGAVIGGLVALVLVAFRAHFLLIAIAVIGAGIFVGNYVQNNKELVKNKLKYFIDKF